MARFGIEEEFVLLDAHALVPIGIDTSAREALTADARHGRVLAEYLTCQVECVTDPVATLIDARAQLAHLRGVVGDHAARHGAVAAASGTPYATTGTLDVSPSPHYAAVDAHLAHLTRGHEVNGLHVHTEVSDDEERVRALNRVRGWLPVLLALTGNSPFVDGLDTRFSSWRSVIIRRLPSSWTPPWFHDLDDYRAQVDRLISLRAVADHAQLSWAARISDRFPTVEVRVFDAQLHPDDTLLAAALTRAIVANPEAPTARASVDALDAALWTASRAGMDAQVLDPGSGEVADAWTVADGLLDAARPMLDALGDLAFVEDRLARIRREGTGAERQRRAFAAGGTAGLRALFTEGTTEAPATR